MFMCWSVGCLTFLKQELLTCVYVLVGWLFNVPAAGALRVFMCWLVGCLTSQHQELYVCLCVG